MDKIVIEVKGGMVQNVWSTHDEKHIKVIVLDFDDLDLTEEQLQEMRSNRMDAVDNLNNIVW